MACIRGPAKDWRRRTGRPRQTWLRTVEFDLRPLNFAGLPWVWGFPWAFSWVWDGYGDYDQSPWACGNSVGIFDWVETKRTCGERERERERGRERAMCQFVLNQELNECAQTCRHR